MKVFIIFILLLSSSFAQAGSIEKAASRLTLDQLFAVQTLLRAKLDGHEVCVNEFTGLSEIAISSMPQLLEAEVRAKIQAMKENGSLVSYVMDSSRQGSCVEKCRCDLYDLALEKAGQPAEKKRAILKPTQVLRCAKANEFWICKNSLFRALIAETKKATE